jgi:hypothetical protein
MFGRLKLKNYRSDCEIPLFYYIVGFKCGVVLEGGRGLTRAKPS